MTSEVCVIYLFERDGSEVAANGSLFQEHSGNAKASRKYVTLLLKFGKSCLGIYVLERFYSISSESNLNKLNEAVKRRTVLGTIFPPGGWTPVSSFGCCCDMSINTSLLA